SPRMGGANPRTDDESRSPGPCYGSAMRAALLVGLVTCGSACTADTVDSPTALDPSFATVESIMDRSCTFAGTCHGGDGVGGARLQFDSNGIKAALFARDGGPRASCEYPPMPLVDPGSPDNSWLIVKIEGPVDDSDRIVAGPWGPVAG